MEVESDPFKDIFGGGEDSQSPFSLDEWNESEHPRKANGQFGEGGSAGVEKSSNITGIMGEEIKDVKGQEAINALLEKKSGYVKNAFKRDDTGTISLIWGDETRGLCHILARRKEQGINTTEFMADLGEVIEKGEFIRTNEKGRYELFYKGKKAIIEPELTNGELTFLLPLLKVENHKKDDAQSSRLTCYSKIQLWRKFLYFRTSSTYIITYPNKLSTLI